MNMLISFISVYGVPLFGILAAAVNVFLKNGSADGIGYKILKTIKLILICLMFYSAALFMRDYFNYMGNAVSSSF